MDLQAAESAHQRDLKDQISHTKKIWHCPCNGCKKAVKQEKQRILEEINKINTDKLNGLGMKILAKEIING